MVKKEKATVKRSPLIHIRKVEVPTRHRKTSFSGQKNIFPIFGCISEKAKLIFISHNFAIIGSFEFQFTLNLKRFKQKRTILLRTGGQGLPLRPAPRLRTCPQLT